MNDIGNENTVNSLISSLPHKAILASLVLLTGCSTLGPNPQAINCAAEQSSCHYGRFGILWKIQQDDGKVQAESLSGSYEWRSGFGPAQNPSSAPYELATLEVNSTLGPSLGHAKRNGEFYEVRAADGRVYLAQDWQTLFDLMFPVSLPANALVDWMKNPNPDVLPPLPKDWAWQNQNGRYRIVFVQNTTTGRIDLIPQGKIDK